MNVYGSICVIITFLLWAIMILIGVTMSILIFYIKKWFMFSIGLFAYLAAFILYLIGGLILIVQSSFISVEKINFDNWFIVNSEKLDNYAKAKTGFKTGVWEK